jgi:hypothetical protein
LNVLKKTDFICSRLSAQRGAIVQSLTQEFGQLIRASEGIQPFQTTRLRDRNESDEGYINRPVEKMAAPIALRGSVSRVWQMKGQERMESDLKV